MASDMGLVLLPPTVVDADGTTTYEIKELPNSAVDLVLVATVSSRTDGTFTATTQTSPDGVNWETLAANGALSANGIDTQRTVPISFGKVRLSLLAASTTTGATVSVVLKYRSDR